MAAAMIRKYDRTVRQWQTDCFGKDGVLPESKQEKYHTTGVIWQNKQLHKKVTEYVRLHVSVKGLSNMTAITFVNE